MWETFCLLLIPVTGILVGSILFTMLIGVKDGVIFASAMNAMLDQFGRSATSPVR